MKILIASSIDPAAKQRLCAGHDVVEAINAPEDVLVERIADREAVIFRSGVQISERVMSAAPDLKLLVRAGSGLDNVDVGYVERQGLHLERIPGPGGRAVAEMTFGLLLAVARRVVEGDQLLREGHWAKSRLGGRLLRDKTLGVVGVGNIGGQVAELGRAWGMHPIGCVDHYTPERAAEMAERGVRLTDIEDVVSNADFITIHVPLNQSTRHLFNAALLAKAKPGAYLVNIARGGVVDEQALHEQLVNGGPLSGAALDVHEAEGEGAISPLAGLPNVVLTPHIGAMATDAQHEIGERIVSIVDGFAS